MAVDCARREVRLPVGERYALHQRCLGRHGARHPDDDRVSLFEARSVEVRVPLESGRALAELRSWPGVVRLRDVLGIYAGDVRLRDSPLECQGLLRLAL